MKVFIIAEIGINHNGQLELAKKMIDTACSAGCDAVKFQKREPLSCVPPEQRNVLRETPWGSMTYIEYRQKVEFGEREYDEIDHYCRKLGMTWLASCWDIESHEFLKKYELKFQKIPSAQLTNDELLEAVAEEKKFTFISTGMSTMEETGRAVSVFKIHDCPFELMHCNSSYPLNIQEANLRCIITLQKAFSCNVGYSGHETGLQISLAAVALGATSLERHITLDRAAFGTDQAASLEPDGLRRLVRDVRIIEQAMGDGIKRVYDSEKPILGKLRYCRVRGEN